MTDPWAAPDRPAPPSSSSWGSAPPGSPDLDPWGPPSTWRWLTHDVLVVGLAALLVLGASSGLAVTRLTDRTSTDVAAAQAELERLLPSLQAFVERERGLEFGDPVDARVLADEDFLDALFAGDGSDRSDEESDTGATLQALGLLAQGEDLDDTVDDALTEGVVGFYDSTSDELVVRGTAIDPYVELVLVHELTHALQDQAFDLDRPELEDTEGEEQSGFQALVEGDATRVERAFYAAQGPDRQRAIDDEEARRFGGNGDTPSVVDVLIAFPYLAGVGYVETLLSDGGQPRLDAAFRVPPTTSEQVLEPLSDDLVPVPVTTPPTPGRRIDEGVVGSVGLALLLPTDPTADGPHLGWGGDRYATYVEGEETCTVVDVVMDDRTDRDRLVEALDSWQRRTRGTVTSTGDLGLQLRSCLG